MNEESQEELAQAPASRRTSLRQEPSNVDTHSHRVPGTQYFALAVWIVLLLVLYGWARVICKFGIPHDCTDGLDYAKVMHDFEYLLFSGVTLAILTGLHWPDRFAYVFSFSGSWFPRGCFFLTTVFLTVPIWGSLDLIPFLSHFAIRPDMSGGYLFLFFLLAVFMVSLVAWHVWVAWKHNSKSGFAAYVLSRLAIMVERC